jgi:predicted TIM-barrel fold metal-dependent hydrolase
MGQLFEVTEYDKKIYQEHLRDFLPSKVIDIHTHVWVDRLKCHNKNEFNRIASWPFRVAKENPMEDLVETYRLMFPDKKVTPLCFSNATKDDPLDELNRYVAEKTQEYNFPALLFTTPFWSQEELEQRIQKGKFTGVKVYLNMSPDYIPGDEIRIFDFLPHHHLRVLDKLGSLVMLHIPRKGRLKDPVNLAQMIEIEEQYPNVKLIIAHVGRAYCPEDIGNAFETLSRTKNMMFDFSANTCQTVFEELISHVGPKRIMFGSDLPIVRMRMRRICENGTYINLVPKGLYGDLSDEAHMREVEGPEADTMTFFMYEELMAFKKAAENTRLSEGDIEDIFYNNARKLIEE